jgi:hypothetical protein
MKVYLVINVELGWDNVVHVVNRENITPEELAELKAMCKRNDYILIDYKSVESVESVLQDY